MIGIRQFPRFRTWMFLLAIAAAFILMPSFAHAQDQPSCASAELENSDSDYWVNAGAQIDVEQTVCIASTYSYAVTENDSYETYADLDTLWIYGVSEEAFVDDLYGNNVYDSTMIYGQTSDTGGPWGQTSATGGLPVVIDMGGWGVGYSLTAWYSECENPPDDYDSSYDDPSNECWDFPYAGLTVYALPPPLPPLTLTTSLNPSGFGQPVTFTATAPNGTDGNAVDFYGNGYLGSGTIDNTTNTATFTTSALVAGSNYIYAMWDNDQYQQDPSNTITQVVTPLSPTLSLSCPQNYTYTSGVVCWATLSGGAPGAPGYVSYYPNIVINGKPTYLAVSDSNWEEEPHPDNISDIYFPPETLPAGAYTIVLNWPGDANDAPASASTTFTIQKATPNFNVVCTPGSPASECTIHIPGATGWVSFLINGKNYSNLFMRNVRYEGVPPYTAGTSAPGSYWPNGPYLITASYSGDANFNPSSASTTVPVTDGRSNNPSTISVLCSPNAIIHAEQTATCTASVNNPIFSAATGTMSFSYNGNTLGTTTLSEDGASWNGFSNLPPGSYNIVASYSGDGNYQPSSGSTTLTIQGHDPSVRVSCSPNPVTYGSQTTCVATVGDGATGTVSFSYNGNALATPITLSGGSASWIGFGTQAVGSYDIVANYSGDSNNNAASASTTLTVQYSQSTPSTIYSYNVSTTGNFGAANGYPGGYDTNGNVLAYTDSVMGSWSFGYDQLNRLVTAANSSVPAGSNWAPDFCWAYDSFGNRLQQGNSDQPFTAGEGGCTFNGTTFQNTLATYNSQNQMISTNAPGFTLAPPGYDGAGDVTADGTNAYLYDAEGRLCAVASNGSMTGYLYDAAGNRVAKGSISTMSCDVTTNGFSATAGYVVGPSGEQLTEVDGNNNWKHTNVYAGGKLIGTYDGNVSAPALHFYFDDPLGTRRAQTNAAGVLEAVYQSLPFGDGLVQNAVTATDDPTENHFTGKERDTESGNDYMFARYYNSATGRFLSPDWDAKSSDPVPYAKLDNPQSLNLYSYVVNNPMALTDNDGHAITCAQGMKDQQTCSDTVQAMLADPNTHDELAGYDGPDNPNLTIQTGDLSKSEQITQLPGGGVQVKIDQGNTVPVLQTSTITDSSGKTTTKVSGTTTITIDKNTSKGDLPGVMVHEGVHAGEARANPVQYSNDAAKEHQNPCHDCRPQEQRANAAQQKFGPEISKAVKQKDKDRKKEDQ
jgi:RHS repeat-associated protein